MLKSGLNSLTSTASFAFRHAGLSRKRNSRKAAQRGPLRWDELDLQRRSAICGAPRGIGAGRSQVYLTTSVDMCRTKIQFPDPEPSETASFLNMSLVKELGIDNH